MKTSNGYEIPEVGDMRLFGSRDSGMVYTVRRVRGEYIDVVHVGRFRGGEYEPSEKLIYTWHASSWWPGGEPYEPHAEPGQFCPTCGGTHCSSPSGHSWNEDSYCIYCGADGRA